MWEEASEAAIEEASRVAAAESADVAAEAAAAADAAEAENFRLRRELEEAKGRLAHASGAARPSMRASTPIASLIMPKESPQTMRPSSKIQTP